MERKRIQFIITLYLVLMAITSAFTQESGSAAIVYAEGGGFTLVRNGETSFYDVQYDDILGMLLYSGDSILTEEDSFLEIQVTSNASLIKIAENTTFEFEYIGNYGGSSLKVAYGRIRAKINKLTNNDEFTVSGLGTVAGVRGTDFGYDLTFKENLSTEDANEAITTVYCFEGSVEVNQQNSDPSIPKVILIGPDEMVSTSSLDKDTPFVVYNIVDDIDTFWEENRFVTLFEEDTSAEGEILLVENTPVENIPTSYTDKIFGQQRVLRYAGGGLAMAGLATGLTGAALLGFNNDESLGISLITIGSTAFITGIIFLIQGEHIVSDLENSWTEQAALMTPEIVDQ